MEYYTGNGPRIGASIPRELATPTGSVERLVRGFRPLRFPALERHRGTAGLSTIKASPVAQPPSKQVLSEPLYEQFLGAVQIKMEAIATPREHKPAKMTPTRRCKAPAMKRTNRPPRRRKVKKEQITYYRAYGVLSDARY